MKQTEQFGLNLWELQDLVRMEDFNSDNAKLEAALASLAQGGAKIKTYAGYSGDSSSLAVGIPIRHIGAWQDWKAAALLIIPQNFSGSGARHSLNTISSSPACGVQFQSTSAGALYLFLPNKDPERLVQGVFFSADMCRFFVGTRPFREAVTVYVQALPENSAVTNRLNYIWIAFG